MSCRNANDSHELTIAAINELEDEGMKVRLKVVLALTEVNKDLHDLRFFDSIPLELMPRLLELVQQELVIHFYFVYLFHLLADKIDFQLGVRWIWQRYRANPQPRIQSVGIRQK